jgi:hypothetical protein
MTIARFVLLLCSVLFISACDNDESKAPLANEQQTPAEPEVAFDPMVSTLDRARAVQGVQAERSADIEVATEEAGR